MKNALINEFKKLEPKKFSSLNSFDLWLTVLEELRIKELKGEIEHHIYFKAIKEKSLLFSTEKDFLINKFGKQDFCFNDLNNSFRHYIWKFQVEHGLIWISSSIDGIRIFVHKNENSSEEQFLENFKIKIRDIFNIKLF
jgi:hypothetical protein